LGDFFLVDRKAVNFRVTIMDEHQNPEEAAKRPRSFKIRRSDLKEATGAKIENIRQAAGQKADEFRRVAQGKVQEFRGARRESEFPSQELASRRRGLRSRQSNKGGLDCSGRWPSVGLSSSKMTDGTGFFASYSRFRNRHR
jgi:hypothetical protein